MPCLRISVGKEREKTSLLVTEVVIFRLEGTLYESRYSKENDGKVTMCHLKGPRFSMEGEY